MASVIWRVLQTVVHRLELEGTQRKQGKVTLRTGGHHLTWIHMLLLPWLLTPPFSGNHKLPHCCHKSHTCIEVFQNHCWFLIRIWSSVFLGFGFVLLLWFTLCLFESEALLWFHISFSCSHFVCLNLRPCYGFIFLSLVLSKCQE